MPAATLLCYCGIGGHGSGGEAGPKEVESFFVELGLEPTPMISKKYVRREMGSWMRAIGSLSPPGGYGGANGLFYTP